MSDREGHTSPPTVIRVVRRDDPVSAVTEDDARRRAVAYPNLRMGGPMFGHAEELGDGRWRIRKIQDFEPQAARDTLAHYFRVLASETEDRALAADLTAADQVLGWEKVNELTVAGRRYRIIRVQTFARFGADGPEPPRPSDADPLPPGATSRATSRSDELVIDPGRPVGLAEGLLKVELLPAFYPAATVPAEVHAESRRAVHTHPDGVFLPVEYTVAEQVDGRWQPIRFTHPTPQSARDSITFDFRSFIPRFQQPTETEIAEYARAADLLDDTRADEVEVLGRRLRVTRVEILLRIGPDGPEPPRPSDHDPEPPAEAHFAQLRAQGLLDSDPAN